MLGCPIHRSLTAMDGSDNVRSLFSSVPLNSLSLPYFVEAAGELAKVFAAAPAARG